VQLTRLQRVFDTDLKKFNDELRKLGLEPIVPKAEEKPVTRPTVTMDDDTAMDEVVPR